MKVKLIRDKFTEGRDGAEVGKLGDHPLVSLALQAKLHEEAEEIARDPGSLEEYGDLMEVLLELARRNGFGQAEVVQAMILKRDRCGGFRDGLIMARPTVDSRACTCTGLAGDGLHACPVHG